MIMPRTILRMRKTKRKMSRAKDDSFFFFFRFFFPFVFSFVLFFYFFFWGGAVIQWHANRTVELLEGAATRLT
jgi:hypothetical protein